MPESTFVMVWAAITATGRSPLAFVPSGVKLNSQRYIWDILEAELLSRALKHFDGAPWTLQQDQNDPKLDSGPHSSVH